MKKALLFLVILLQFYAAYAQLKSPEQFLGYKLGTRFTPHHKLMAYCNYIAANSNMVKLQQYGETNEYKPLVVLFVGTPQHIQDLEAIRKNNLRLAHQASDKTEGSTQAPAIVWLSYNVHGNEPTSSEAALQTLYELVNPANEQTKTWLQNTIVIIDPCLNPDGRDRYVNWFTGVAGKKPNPVPFTREHIEPWPRGRSNHYNFDLNRDWAWQSQIESRQRVALYNTWLPQLHADFHEQSYAIPYFFAPAAEPYFEDITKWQRDFQKTIGKNHAKYFDANGWLYFTKERFDLLYPSYGDTYPTYNGSIGLTYEQGGIGGGLSVITPEKDTLTFVERVLHHHTVGLSTVEVSSQNANKLVTEFKNYFNDAVNGKIGKYKTYIIKYQPQYQSRINALKQLLLKNNIEFGTASGAVKGFNYFSGKVENVTIDDKDVVISTRQPRAVLANIFFEPDVKLTDSITYDITAWALPYVFGLNSYASTQTVSVNGHSNIDSVSNTMKDAYAYVFAWDGIAAAKTLAQLLTAGIKVRFSEKPFTIGDKAFPSGSAIILKNNNIKASEQLWSRVKRIADDNNILLHFVGSGMVDAGADFGSTIVRQVKSPNVVLVTGNGTNSNAAGEVWNFFDNELGYPLQLVNASEMDIINWETTDVIIMPYGNYDVFKQKQKSDKLHDWIKNGGKLICLENAVAQVSKQEWSSLKLIEEKKDSTKKRDSITASVYENREKEDIAANTPGAIFKVWVDNTHPLMFGYPNFYYTLKMDGHIYEPIKNDGWNVGVIKNNKQVAGFVGHKLSKNLKNGVLFAVQDIGKGNVVYLADNVLFRDFWENGKQMFANAVFFVGQ